MNDQDNLPPNPESEGREEEPHYSPWLVLHDGIPWYASSDIWVVPGPSPNGVPGPPRSGKANWVWTRVWNYGEAPIFNAVVNFYWADPSTGVRRSNAIPLGSEFVSVPAKSYKEIYCSTPWTPALVNIGHECLVVEAYEPLLDPLSFPSSNDFHVTADRHVAQRNVVLAIVALGEMIKVGFMVTNPDLENDKVLDLHVEGLELDELAGLSQSLGLAAWPPAQLAPAEAHIFQLGMAQEGTPDGNPLPDESQDLRQWLAASGAEPCSRVALGPGERAEMVLLISPADRAREGQAHAYSVTQGTEGQVTGGMVVLAINAKSKEAQMQREERFRNAVALEYVLSNHPELLRELLENPTAVLERLGVSEEALRCPDEAHVAYERGRQAAEAVSALGELPMTEALPRILRIAEELIGKPVVVYKVPYGLRFVEPTPEPAEATWTATATFECTFSPGCHGDTDG
jgi:hypothetical protein